MNAFDLKNSSSRSLRIFTKCLCGATLFLIFVGGLVTSTGSGLAVPDWPLSYGTLFPPMVGGVLYEHGHRMVASGIGCLTVILAIWLWRKEKRRWVRNLGWLALAAVVCQGILGGVTVLFFLPPAISTLHAVLAQSFFILTIIIAYSQSRERAQREDELAQPYDPYLLKLALIFSTVVYIQLIIAAFMRHTGSGLAIPDFPTMGGSYLPLFDEKMLGAINHVRFLFDLDPVVMWQVIVHFIHRAVALLILILVLYLSWTVIRSHPKRSEIIKTVFILDLLVLTQILLGISTVLTLKSTLITTLHVMTGAATLGMSILFILRVSPTALTQVKMARAKR